MKQKRALLTLWASALLALPMQAQQTGEWVTHDAYHDATACTMAGPLVFGLYDSHLMSYDTETEEVRTYSRLQGLHGNQIRCMAYCPSREQIILMYTDANIDLLSTRTGDVYNIPQLRSSNLTTNSTTNINVVGDQAYIGLDGGVAIIDIGQQILKAFYQIDQNVVSATAAHGYLYAATSNDGLYFGKLTDNLHDKAYWKHQHARWALSQVTTFQDCLFIRGNGSMLMRRTAADTIASTITTEGMTYMNANSQGLVAGNAQKLLFFSQATGEAQTHTTGPQTGQYAMVTPASAQSFWAAANTRGLLQLQASSQADTLVAAAHGISFSGPVRDLCYYMREDQNDVLIAGGYMDYSGTRHPGTIMSYDGQTWKSWQEDGISSLTGLPYADITSVVRSQSDNTCLYATSADGGMYVFKDYRYNMLYDESNSTLKSAIKGNPLYVRTNGLNYDQEGNLWLLNQEADNTLHALLPDGTWKAFYNASFTQIPTPEKTYVDPQSRIWATSRRTVGTKNGGVLCFDYNHTLNDESDDQWTFRSSVTNQDGTSVTFGEVYALTPDRNGAIWIGCSAGVLVIDNPDLWSSSNCYVTQPKIPRNDGTNNADYLLQNIDVTAICVDAENRKWIGTASGGLYLFNADGTEELGHFTTDNSPLPSNLIYSIAIVPSTGEVLVGTDKGMAGYMSGVSASGITGSKLKVSPNPVRPDYYGPISIKGLPPGADLKIISVSGQVVASGKSDTGSFEWNGLDRSGRRPSSGVYTIVLTDSGGKHAASGQITILR